VTPVETINKAAIKDITDLASIIPSLRVTTLQTSTQTNFVIRGFGNGANNPGIEPSVGVFIDGVYRSRSAGAIGDLVDVSRVEVLRGPQSTLFGQNASAGVISIITQKPSFEWGGYVEGTVGNYNSNILKSKITGPLSDTVAFSLSAVRNERDGYFKELKSGAAINDRDRSDVRAQLLWKASDNFELRLIGDTSTISEVCCGVSNLVLSIVSITRTSYRSTSSRTAVSRCTSIGISAIGR
jgi:iron complex outermembrane recepter protein